MHDLKKLLENIRSDIIELIGQSEAKSYFSILYLSSMTTYMSSGWYLQTLCAYVSRLDIIC